MKTFHRLLAITLLSITTNNFVWFALIFWAYLETQSVISTSFMGGIFLVMMAGSGFWMGSLVDHHKKKTVMLGSSLASLALFLLGWLLLHAAPEGAYKSVASPWLWILVVVLLAGTLSGMIYNIAVPTLVAFLVPESERDKANGLFGSTVGVAFALTSVFSGVSLAYGGMNFVLIAAAVATGLVLLAMALTPVEEKGIVHVQQPGGPAPEKKADLRGTIKLVRAVPGLFALIFFSTFNNFIGGVFMALMDAYGLSLVSVEVWGFLWGFLSLSMIMGGLYIAKKGLGSAPLSILFRNNIIAWTVCIFFTIQPSIVLLTIGTFIWMFLMPFTEAIEQTILQKVVPPERLGRVLGFAHSVEQAASPITAFLIGPIAQVFFIPFMTTGRGVELIGSWFGTGTGRGIALVFTAAGVVGLMVTLWAMRSRSYALLAQKYAEPSEPGA